jgi:hypothetical protein
MKSLPLLVAGAALAGMLAADRACGAQLQAGACPVSPDLRDQPAAVALIARARAHLDATPQALAHLHTEGTLPHQGIRDASERAERDFPLMRDAALAWRLTGEPAFAAQVDTDLRAWLGLYEPDFNPIDETRLDALIQAYVLAQPALATGTVALAQSFLRRLAQGYIAQSSARVRADRRPSGTWVNNWQSHRIKLMALSAAALQDPALMQEVRSLFAQQIENNVRPDGSVEDFEDRDALHYVVYDLEPLTAAALAARQFGQDWLHLKGSRGQDLAAALDWLVPYAQGSRTHEEFVHTHVAFDRKRAKAGLPGYAGLWDPQGAATLFRQAAQLDPAYQDLTDRLTSRAPEWQLICMPPRH